MATFLSCLISLGKTSSPMLNRHGESGHLFLAPDFESRLSAFHQWVLAVVLFSMAFIVLRYIPSIPTLLSVFVINGRSLLSDAFYASVEMIMWFLSLILLLCCITWIILWMLNVCIPGINPIWSWCLILSVYYWIWFVNTLLRNFATISTRDTGL